MRVFSSFREKIAFFLEKTLLLDLAVFLILAPYSKVGIKVCFGIAMVLWLTVNIFRHRKHFYRGFLAPNPLNRPILLFLGAVILSTLFSISLYHSQGFLFDRYIFYFLFFLLGAYIVKNRNNANFLILSFILGATVVAIGAIFDYFTVTTTKRFATSFGGGVFLTQYLVFAIPGLFALTIFPKRILINVTSGIVSFLLILFLIWNQSRAALLAVATAFLLIYFLKNRRNAIVSAVSMLGIFIFLISLYAFPRFKSWDKFADPALRPVRWESALNILKDHPAFGSGLGTIELIFTDYAPILKDKGPHVHNTFLEVAAEMGLVGVITFIFIFIVLFKSFFNFVKMSSETKDSLIFAFATGLFGGILATLIISLSCTVITVGINNATLFWFTLGVLASLIA